MSWRKQDYDIIIKEFENDICPVCGKALKLHMPIELKYCLRKSKTRVNFSGGGEGISGDRISFPESNKSYCVGIVDIVISTKIIALLNKSKICQYYSVFLNSMASIIREHGGVVVKNIGDSLLYYFPKTSDPTDIKSFIDVIECGMRMINAHGVLNSKMQSDGLPYVDYRISFDYGIVMVAKLVNSSNDDIFGSTVNLCSKIVTFAKPNTMVIGGDLYHVVKSFEEYQFESISEYQNGLKILYPIYCVKHKRTDT